MSIHRSPESPLMYYGSRATLVSALAVAGAVAPFPAGPTHEAPQEIAAPQAPDYNYSEHREYMPLYEAPADTASSVEPISPTTIPHVHAEQTSVTVEKPPVQSKTVTERPSNVDTIVEQPPLETETPPDLPLPIIETPPEKPVEQDPVKEDPSEETPQFNSLFPERLTIPADASGIMEKDTVRIDGLFNNCSGKLIRSGSEVIGFSSAEHCGLRGNANGALRTIGEDGKKYIVTPYPTVASTGNSQAELTPANTLSELYAPADTDTSLDLVVGAFEGHTAKEVLAAHQQNQLSKEQLATLKTGDVMYISGWPVHQPANIENLQRQEFAMSIIGLGQTATTIGEHLNVVWAAVPKSEDGTVCSFGASGSEGFIMKDGQARNVGVLAAFVDLTGELYGQDSSYAEDNINYFADTYNLNPEELRSMGAICGFDYSIPSEANGAETIQVVDSIDKIPGYEKHTPEALLTAAREQFFDPAAKRQVLDGIAEVYSDTGETTYIDRPYISYDEITDAVVLGSYDSSMSDGLNLTLLENPYFMHVYDRDAEPGVTMLNINGSNTVAEGNFQDENQLLFGSTNLELSANLGQLYGPQIVDGVLQYQPLIGKGGSK